jgi:beta-xylosidase
MNIPQHIKDEAELYANEISKNDTYREYLRNAYISGRMKSEGELAIAFGEWLVVEYVNTISNKWRKFESDKTYTTPELYAIFQQSKAAK